eukprot:scaffold1596_cov302-Pinguiococcus_pyrenoidosus.AAC.31
MGHRYPLVRKHAAEELYHKLLVDDATFVDLHAEQQEDEDDRRPQEERPDAGNADPESPGNGNGSAKATSKRLSQEALTVVMDALSCTQWDGEMNEARSARQRIAASMQIDLKLTDKPSKASRGAFERKQSEELASYEALVREAGVRPWPANACVVGFLDAHFDAPPPLPRPMYLGFRGATAALPPLCPLGAGAGAGAPFASSFWSPSCFALGFTGLGFPSRRWPEPSKASKSGFSSSASGGAARAVCGMTGRKKNAQLQPRLVLAAVSIESSSLLLPPSSLPPFPPLQREQRSNTQAEFLFLPVAPGSVGQPRPCLTSRSRSARLAPGIPRGLRSRRCSRSL